jgi:hypothetical protein
LLSAGFETVDVEPSYLQEAAAGVGGGDDTVLEAGKQNAVFEPFVFLLKRLFCQDRLGTNI